MQSVSTYSHNRIVSIFGRESRKLILTKAEFHNRYKKSRPELQISRQITGTLFHDNDFRWGFDNSYRLESEV